MPGTSGPSGYGVAQPFYTSTGHPGVPQDHRKGYYVWLNKSSIRTAGSSRSAGLKRQRVRDSSFALPRATYVRPGLELKSILLGFHFCAGDVPEWEIQVNIG
jgi:hypothetical protein